MDDRNWERFSSLSGVIFAALILIRTLMLSPVVPTASAPDELAHFFVVNASTLRLNVFLTGVIVIFGTWFFGGLRAYLVRRGLDRLANIMFAGWILQGALALVRHTFIAVPALAVPSAAASLAPAALFIAAVMLGFVWMCAFIIAGATSIASSRADVFPSWFGWLTAFAAVLFLLGGLAVTEPVGFFSSIGNFRWIVLYGYVGWAAIASLVLYQRLGVEER